jgi:FKBP-type peptidyl-prolyl cis-trans isomerase FkpA
MIKNMKPILAGIALMLLFSTCDKGPDQADIDDEIIQQYLSEHNITATRHSSGLYYTIAKAGYGGHPDYYSVVEVVYKGYLTDGTVFDQTAAGKTVSFELAGLIQGWQIGIPLLQKSGKGTFYVPSGLGYGDKAQPEIPANSVLIFEITLVNFY